MPLIFVLMVLSASHSLAVMTGVIQTDDGPVQGFYMMNSAVFLGIPFAAPPQGKLRFMAPSPPQKWTKTRMATKFSSWCIQNKPMPLQTPQDILTQIPGETDDGASQGLNYTMSEDCLYLNVFSPNITSTSKYPVMFFIHGGGYTIGTAAQYPPGPIITSLVKRGVVVVTTNYRLNVFGFFSTYNSVVPGNMGLRDQIMALTWTKNEIAKFGGDPTQITVFGESAGSGSTSLLTMSPLAQDMISKAIMESGSGFCPWALDGNNYQYSMSSQQTATAANCITNSLWTSNKIKTKMLTCLQAMNASQLFQIATKAAKSGAWTPVVDGKGGVLPDWPRNLVKSRPQNMPLLIGTNHDEAADFIIGLFAPQQMWVSNFTKKLYDGFVNQMVPPTTTSKKMAVYAAIETAFITTPPKPNDHWGWLRTTVAAQSGFYFFAGARKDIDTALQNGNPNVYAYSFDYASKAMPYIQNYTEVGHAYELFYLFKGISKYWLPNLNWTFNSNDNAIANQVGNIWTTFAKTGNLSTLGIMPVSAPNPTQYYSINNPSSMMPNYHTISANVWNRVVPAIMGGPPTRTTTTAPTAAPTTAPTAAPTTAPTAAPTTAPTAAPTTAPTAAPTTAPTAAPTTAPTAAPTTAPTAQPSTQSHGAAWNIGLSRVVFAASLFSAIWKLFSLTM